jgi:2-polyprenyl-3-methyl-5-hydroxy-6-metoxy-1,4-benzoquinol methylase
MNQEQQCPICNSKGSVIYTNAKDSFFGYKGKWDYFKCNRCNSLWLDKSVNLEDVESSYKGYYTSSTPKLSAKGSLLNKIKRKAFLMHNYFFKFAKERDSILSDLVFLTTCENLDKSVLDIGCGNGNFLKFINSLSVKAYGIEPDSASRKVATKNSNCKVCSDTTQLNKLKFDTIVMNNVIEHIADPIDFLIKLRPLLKKGGSVVIRTPNANSRLHKYFNKFWRGLEPPRHLVIFNRESLINAFDKSGYNVLRSYTHDKPADYIYKNSFQAENEIMADKSVQIIIMFFSKLRSFFWFFSKFFDKNHGEEIFLVAKIGKWQ